MLMFLIQFVISEITVSMRHNIFGILLSFGRMAGLAVIGADHHMHLIAVMLKGISMSFGSECVALGTPHHNVFQVIGNRLTGDFAGDAFHCHGFLGGDHGVAAFLPATDNARMNRCMAIDAFGAGLAQRYLIRHSKAVNQYIHADRQDDQEPFHTKLLMNKSDR